MSLTVFDVTVRSTAVIVLSMITLRLVTKNRNSTKTRTSVTRVDNQGSNLSLTATNSWNIRSIALIGLTGIFSAVLLAVFTSVILAVLISKLTGSMGQ